jgi:hypothetical protein
MQDDADDDRQRTGPERLRAMEANAADILKDLIKSQLPTPSFQIKNPNDDVGFLAFASWKLELGLTRFRSHGPCAVADFSD